MRHRSIAAMQNSQTAIVLGVPFLVILGVILLGNPLFEGNDDTGLAMVGAGFGLAAEPDAHLVFSHYGYGLLLGIVSRLVGPGAHGWISLAALGLSVGLYARALCVHSRRYDAVAAALITAIGCVFARALLEMQFTITAALLFGAAMGCWLAVQREEFRSPALSAAIYGALVLSFLIRPTAAVLGLIVIGPALLWLAWRGPAGSRRPTRHLLVALAAIGLMVYLTDKAAYAFSADWREAIEYNQLRSLFNDYFRIPWIPGDPEYAKVGWSANDHAMFMSWYSLDPIFDHDNIQYLVQTLLLKAPLLAVSGVPDWFTELWQSSILGAIVVVLLLLLVLFPRQRRFVFLVLTGTMAAIVVSGLTGRPPVFRVLFSAVSVAFLFVFPFLFTAERLRPFQRIGLGLLVGIAILAGSTTLQAHEKRVAEAAAYRAKLSEAAQYFSGTVISWAANFMWELLITPTTVHAPVAGLTIPSIGLFTNMPVMRSSLQRLGIVDLGATLCTQPDVRLIAEPWRVGMLQTFCEEHYHVRPTYNLVFDYSRTQIFVSGQPGRKE